jgi:hypothetical protein
MKYPVSLIIIILVLFFTDIEGIHAQTSVRLAFTGGVNFANARTEGFSLSTSNRTGLMVGGFLEVPISDIVFIQPEILYIQKGLKIGPVVITGNDPTPLGTTDLVYSFDYIEIPILLKTRFGGTEIKPFLFAGPNIGFNLSANKQVVGVDVQSQGMIITENVKDQTESIDFAIDLGGGAEYQMMSKLALFVDARYSMGLTNISKNTQSSSTAIKSTGIQFLLGVLLNL